VVKNLFEICWCEYFHTSTLYVYHPRMIFIILTMKKGHNISTSLLHPIRT
jgi:hypothetical protein